ncbi:hypothetical protein J2R78_009095 [Bradyrhizobium sp. USDA 4538]|nr:hypothetical protein [Bradyrhizobium sp. USDA 4538]MCP1907305.1 hypothetical protein [Bradyrhizobium sp. USDA 4537]MCP1985781.1 hypothetical protein [Bradyrhizobium sp. USDA 4539]
MRQEQSKPLLDDMHAWLLRERETLSRSSEVLKPINYMLRRWDDFARFLRARAGNRQDVQQAQSAVPAPE